MNLKTKTLSLVLIIFIFFGCKSEDESVIEVENEIKMQVIFQDGFLKTSDDERTYMTYNLINTPDGAIHIYQTDSFLYCDDESIWHKRPQEMLLFTKIEIKQSDGEDSLRFKRYSKSCYDTLGFKIHVYPLTDSITVKINERSFIIYKYEIPNPPADGDNSWFYNPALGLLGELSSSWPTAKHLTKHPSINNQELNYLYKEISKNYEFCHGPNILNLEINDND